MKRVLVTGFEPFGGESLNPSAEIAKALDGALIEGAEVIGRVLPCAFGLSTRKLLEALKEHRPTHVLCFGQAGGREGITPERVAINVDDARIRDNRGQRPIDVPVVKGGPVGYWSTLPIKPMVAALAKGRIKASVSQSAGTYVCNHVFYALMHALKRSPHVRAGFIHVPYAAEQGKGSLPSLPLATILAAGATCVSVAVRYRGMAKIAGGALC